MKKNGIKLIVSLLCILALLVGCSNGNDSSNQTEVVENEILEENEKEYEYVTVSLLSNAGSEIKTYETILQDGISYVLIDDFVDLCYRVSEYDHYIENVDISRIDEDIISIEYNPEFNYFRSFEYNKDSDKWTINTSNVYDDNLIKEIHILDTVYEKIEIDENYYVPVNLIQYHIYNGSEELYILNDEEFILLGLNMLSEDYLLDIELNNDIDYTKGLVQIEELLEVNSPEKDIEDYTEYTIERAKTLIAINDGHYRDLWIQDEELMDMERIFDAQMETNVLESDFVKFIIASNEKGVHEHEDNYVEIIDDETVYIKVGNFMDTDTLINTLNFATKDFSEDKQYNLTIDLRDNTGGYFTNGFEFIEAIAIGPFEFQVDLTNDDIQIERIYEFSKDDGIYNDYDIDVLVNEYTISCGVVVAEILADSFNADIYGTMPQYDSLSRVVFIQMPDRSLVRISDLNAEHKTWEELGIVVQNINEYDMIDLESLEAYE